jgi:hypothetical protein
MDIWKQVEQGFRMLEPEYPARCTARAVEVSKVAHQHNGNYCLAENGPIVGKKKFKWKDKYL